MQKNQNNKSLFNEFPPVTTEAWNERLKVDLKTETPESILNWKNSEAGEIKAFYRQEDMKAIDYLESMPASAPFHRGTKTNNDWEVNRIVETADIKEANKLAIKAISRGATSIEFNCTNVSKIDDMSTLLENINLEKIAIRFDKAISFKIILKHFVSYIESKGFNKSKINGSFNWDAMSYRLVTGEYYQTLEQNIDELKLLIEETNKELPNFKVLSINMQHFHNAGSTLIQELSFGLSAAVEYTQRLLDKGVALSTILKHIHFRVAIGSSYFMEIAKFRSLRFLWSKIVKAFDEKAEQESKTYIIAISGSWNKSIFDPYVNLLRTTTETMSAAIAGVDVITVSRFDKIYHPENEFASRIAQNQQILVKEEAHFNKVVDPSAGSYYIEHLTDSIIGKVWDEFLQVEEKGGYAAAIESNFVKSEIEKSAEKKQLEVATRKVNVLGTNQFPNQLEFMIDELQKETCKETCSKTGLKFTRGASGFEKVRLQTETFAKETGKRPKVLLISFGNLAMRKARAAFISNFFACAGYEIIEFENCKNAAEGAKKISEIKPNIAIFCSADDEYLEFATAFNTEIQKQTVKPIILVAGNPSDAEDLKKVGVEAFIHVKLNVLKCLSDFQNRLLVK